MQSPFLGYVSQQTWSGITSIIESILHSFEAGCELISGMLFPFFQSTGQLVALPWESLASLSSSTSNSVPENLATWWSKYR